MKTLILFFLSIFSAFSFGHDLLLSGQHLKINQQNESAWQSDILARASMGENWELGIQSSYLSRFDLHEKNVGVLASFRPFAQLKLEAKYLKANSEAKILPLDHYFLNFYSSVAKGLSPFLFYQNARYSTVNLHSMKLGMEIENIKQLIVIPMIMWGQSYFEDPQEVREVHSFGLKAIYLKESDYFFSLFAFRGVEISQAISGVSGKTIDTSSAGLGLGMWPWENFKTEFVFDYTDYQQLNNQFLSSTINLSWSF